MYSVVMTMSVIALLCGNILATRRVLLIISMCCAFIIICMSFWALPLITAKVNVYSFFSQVVYLQFSVGGYFFLADEACVPGGPHFTYAFYNTIATVIGNIASLIGVVLFTYLFSKKTFQFASITTNVIRVIAGVFDIIIIKR
uniref:Uncharacterized protein n=1 Tax=Lygus hesperus TaxID=30085 RepID=A0A0A9YGS9_LYGHE